LVSPGQSWKPDRDPVVCREGDISPGALHGPGGLIPRSPEGVRPPLGRAGPHARTGLPAGRHGTEKGEAVNRWRFEVKRLVLVFNKEKETKGTYRYQEVEVAERDTAVGSLYLKKAVVGDPPPAQLRVTIEANPGAPPPIPNLQR
jgi:hypothetical protein